jgi:hypothetical protein
MRNYKLIKILLMIVINSIIISGGTHAEHLPEVKTRPAQETEKDVFPDLMFFASYLYQ